MAPAIEGQEMDVARKLVDDAVPHALIERERMNERKPGRILVLRGAQRIDDRAAVGGREYPGLRLVHRSVLYLPAATVEHICGCPVRTAQVPVFVHEIVPLASDDQPLRNRS